MVIYRGRKAHLVEFSKDGPGGPYHPLHKRLDLANHSPTGFSWGYGGSGPAQLALAILAHYLRETTGPHCACTRTSSGTSPHACPGTGSSHRTRSRTGCRTAAPGTTSIHPHVSSSSCATNASKSRVSPSPARARMKRRTSATSLTTGQTCSDRTPAPSARRTK